uniref:Uncharacterized protein n=1 Tax=Brassica oleracea var. oleracea TaxID=109376 RepID=A0A0D3E0K9_BRAOL
MSKICNTWNYVSNHSSDEDGRIVLIWKDPLRLQVVKQSRQSMTCTLTLPNKEPVYFTSVYAANTSEERVDLWVELMQLHASLNLDSKQWIIGGDFNQITHPADHSSPTVNTPDNLMYQLQDCFIQCGAFDLRYNGPPHTWTNYQPFYPIGKKLDRLLVNSPTISSHPQAFASFLPQLFSDHSPCLLDLAFTLPKAGTKPFKFQNYLTKHPNFLEMVSRAWVLALQSPTPLLFQQERDLHQKWLFLRQIEESYFRQKSRINWLSEGDFNTTFFHRMCQVRESYNAIRSFLSSNGILVTDPMEMSELAVEHFKAILGPSNYLRPAIWSPHSWFADLIQFRCSLQQSQLMLSVPSADAIRAMFFKLNPNKAPGPDGLTSGSIHNYWTTKPKASFSWLANKLLKLKDVVFPLIKLRLENGMSARFWFDNWSPFGSIATYLNLTGSRLGIPLSATVASLYRNGNWRLPPARSEQQTQLQIHLTTVNLTSDKDYFEWEIDSRVTTTFSIGDVYTYLRGTVNEVDWATVVWNSYGIPRHNFHTWLMILDRCPTRDRLLRWGISASHLCLLCNNASESRDHIYFDCNFSFDLWAISARRCGLTPNRSWSDTITQLKSLPMDRSSRPHRLLVLLAWQSTIYWVWNERNARLHSNTYRSIDSLFKTIDLQIRNRTQSFRVTNPRLSSQLLQSWIRLA